MSVTKIPTAAVPHQVSAEEMWKAPKPTDRQVWGVCPYIRGTHTVFPKCAGCPEWEEDEDYGKVKRGCRMLAEEACRVVMAARWDKRDDG